MIAEKINNAVQRVVQEEVLKILALNGLIDKDTDEIEFRLARDTVQVNLQGTIVTIDCLTSEIKSITEPKVYH